MRIETIFTTWKLRKTTRLDDVIDVFHSFIPLMCFRLALRKLSSVMNIFDDRRRVFNNFPRQHPPRLLSSVICNLTYPMKYEEADNISLHTSIPEAFDMHFLNKIFKNFQLNNIHDCVSLKKIVHIKLEICSVSVFLHNFTFFVISSI